MKKKGNKKMPTPRHIHNPIPTSLFLSRPQYILSAIQCKGVSLPNAHSKQTNKILKQNKHVGMGL